MVNGRQEIVKIAKVVKSNKAEVAAAALTNAKKFLELGESSPAN